MNDFEKKVKSIIREYKHRYFDDPKKYDVPMLHKGEVVGRLRPVPTPLEGVAAKDALLQTEWRNLHMNSFIAPPFVATEERTKKWLANTYDENDTIIIFMIETSDGLPVGHVGLSDFDFDRQSAEVGRLLRGTHAPLEIKRRVNLVEMGFNRMVAWGYEVLGVKIMTGRGFADNFLAVRMNAKNGMHPVGNHMIEKEGKPIKMVNYEGTPSTFERLS